MYQMKNQDRRLPGIRFKVEPPAPEEALPRMDITAFVGFAASGPLDIPVAVEDMARFRDIFGDDLPLARDGETGKQQYAHLAPAVEAFFKNGGKRCRVVRVAGKGAFANRFTLPGLVDTEKTGPVPLFSRSPGSWSDSLRVGTVLNRNPLKIATFQCGESDYSIELSSPFVPGQVETGDLVRVDGDFDDIYLVLFLAVDTVDVQNSSQSPGKNRPVQCIRGKSGYWFVLKEDNTLTPMTESAGVTKWKQKSISSPLKTVPGLRLTFDILVWDGETVTARMSRLGFYHKHPRFWAGLPRDHVLFDLKTGTETRAGELESEAAEPRFPLAGPPNPSDLYLPEDMAQVPDRDATGGAVGNISVDNALVRDGLETFDTSLFIDPDLGDVGMGALLGEANHKYYIEEKNLKGIHSLLPLEEVTVLAVPDVVHREWISKEKESIQWLDAPLLQTGDPPKEPEGSVLLKWTSVIEGALYTLQESEEPLFLDPVTIYNGPEISVPVVSCTGCTARYFYRVYAQSGEQLSPWSNTLDVMLPDEEFDACTRPPLTVPVLQLVSQGPPGDESYALKWTGIAGVDGYVLEESEDPVFFGGVVVYEGMDTSFSLAYRTDEDRVYYYRVRTKGPVLTAWSNTCRLANPGTVEWLLNPVKDYSDEGLLDVQRAVLRFCAARGDILSILSLPRHYKEEDVLSHVKVLGSVLGAGTESSEDRMLSFGALYHPWVLMGIESGKVASSGDSVVRYVPPDGVVCGTVAARALNRGAWIAPANEPFQGVAALIPSIRPGYREQLYREQVNIINDDPRGYLVLSADTLSAESALQPINVRRLMILLRRLALREGMTYVFQPNTPDFRRRVQYRFERLLGKMYSRGAFAGDSPETSYQVVTDSSVNTSDSQERGRFIVELKVAPSLPMTFITVRLVQTHDQGLSITEVA